MKKVFVFAAIVALFGLFSCRKVELGTKNVNTSNVTVNGNSATLKGFLDSDVDLTSVTKVYFLLSKDKNVPTKGSQIVESTLSGSIFSSTVSDLEYAVDYYFKAAVDIGKKTYTGKVVPFTTDPLHVTSVQIKNGPFKLLVGETAKIEYEIYPANATDKRVTFMSSNGYASVSDDGTVTGDHAGECKITVKTVDGGKTANCEVTVRSVCPTNGADLGLSVYWSRQNAGADDAIDAGVGFRYPTMAYSSQLLKSLGDKTVGEVHGSGWYAPTREQVLEMFNNCTTSKTVLDGVSGLTFTSKKNGCSFFIPDGEYYTDTNDGTRTHTDESNYGPGGYHWNYYIFVIENGTIKWSSKCGRYTSLVRPVME